MTPDEFNMPRIGEAWRHYKNGYPSLYTIVGVGQDHAGVPVVVYTQFDWNTSDNPPLYTQPLGRFLEQVEVSVNSVTGETQMRPRFKRERSAGCDPTCRYINRFD